MLWPPSSDIPNTAPGLKMKDLKSSVVRKFHDASPDTTDKRSGPTGRIIDAVMSVLLQSNRPMSCVEVCKACGFTKTPVRDSLNLLMADKKLSAKKLGRVTYFQVTQWALQKADD